MEDPHDRLRRARIKAGYANASDAARAFGWKEVTYMAHESGRRGLRNDTARKYGKAFGVSPAYLLTGETSLNGDNLVQRGNVKHLEDAAFGGPLEAGAFRELEMFGENAGAPVIKVPRDERFPDSRQYFYELRGDSMDQVGMPHGVYVIAIDYLDYVEQFGEVKSGAFVVVERLRFGGQILERTVKELFRAPDAFELRPRSSNPIHKPIIVPLNHSADDGIEVRFIGVVIGVYLPVPL